MFRKWIKRFSALAAAAACLCAPAYAAPPGYTQAGHTENVFFYGDQGYQIEYRYDIENKFSETIRDYIGNYNEFLSGDDYDVYFYFVNNSRSIDFTDMDHANDTYDTIRGMLTCADHSDCLKIDSFDTYMKYFYQTDHHWKHTGAQVGYTDILSLLFGPDEKPYEPVEEVTFDVIHNGSYYNRTRIANSTEKFSVYRYDLPELKVTVNGKKQLVDRQEYYFAGKFTKKMAAAHYDLFYGGDWGELVYESGRTDRGNLLVLTNSYGCPMRRLLSQHFNKTYFVDLRFYMIQTQKSMRIRQYVEDHDIDKILVLGDVALFMYGKQLH